MKGFLRYRYLRGIQSLNAAGVWPDSGACFTATAPHLSGVHLAAMQSHRRFEEGCICIGNVRESAKERSISLVSTHSTGGELFLGKSNKIAKIKG